MSTSVGYEGADCRCLSFKRYDPLPENGKRNRLANNEVDDILVKGMKHLSFDELQREQEELHGVSENISENSEEIKRMLTELDDHLQYLKPGTAYESAETMNQEYVRNDSIRMTFLRGRRYDPKASADNMIRYFDMKSKLFGTDKLTKDITLHDLDEDDTECLLNGSYQLSRLKDSSNRTLLLQFPGLRSYKTLTNELRARFYFHFKMIESLGNDTRGIVVVSYSVGRFRDSMGGAGMLENTRMGMSMPFHVAGIHICMDGDGKEALVAKAAIAVCSAQMKAKLKLHTGSHQECQYLLSTFGIPRAAFPISSLSNDGILENQMSWFRKCLRSERGPQGEEDSSYEVPPNENDVLFLGRTVNNGGNERLRTLVAHHAETYKNGSSKDKRNAVSLIMESIRWNGGRFLKPSESGLDWQEVPLSEVRLKLTQMFRNQNRPRVSIQRGIARDFTEHQTGPIVETISDDDVVLGRKYTYPGNKKLRQLVENMAEEYNASNRGRKKEISDILVGTVKSNGGRFLKHIDNARWIEVSDKVAEVKVSSHFRNFRRKATGE
ncbi:unnamed protein product [Cylindrotheca closterium]|uniref:DUF6824 domain-containing protein n=1 Tax=Cylindrotheca closterium TaxID=2856 RepID=A0AAD2CH75_9STRA|nr:unnamed protein product [Cylindrotheca closterium]